jgi:hypothetical protein
LPDLFQGPWFVFRHASDVKDAQKHLMGASS